MVETRHSMHGWNNVLERSLLGGHGMFPVKTANWLSTSVWGSIVRRNNVESEPLDMRLQYMELSD